MESFSSSYLLCILWRCCDGLLCIVCIYHIQNWMLDSKTDCIQKIDCLRSLACYPCAAVQIRYFHQLHKRTIFKIVKEEKNQIPSLSCKHRAKIRRFLANHSCKWLPAELGRRLPGPSHCTGFTCSTLPNMPNGSALVVWPWDAVP